jgi:ribosomal protein S18 acetylase RimI-like enzyme
MTKRRTARPADQRADRSAKRLQAGIAVASAVKSRHLPTISFARLRQMTDRKCLIRVATEADLRAVAEIHVASWQDAYQGIIPDALLADRSVEDSLSGWRRTFAKYPANITVAAAQDGVVRGFCCAGPVVDPVKNASFEFEIYGLHVSPDFRQQGFGAALVGEAFARAKEREGMDSAIVWTLRDLRLSRRFYEREGGKVVKTGVWSVAGFQLPELAYGWTSLTPPVGTQNIA